MDGRAWQTHPHRAEETFDRSTDGLQVDEKLAAGSSSQVQQGWDGARSAIEACRSFTVTTAGGAARYTLAPVAFPAYGEGAYAAKVTISSSRSSVAGEAVIVRQDSALIQITVLGADGAAQSVVERSSRPRPRRRRRRRTVGRVVRRGKTDHNHRNAWNASPAGAR